MIIVEHAKDSLPGVQPAGKVVTSTSISATRLNRCMLPFINPVSMGRHAVTVVSLSKAPVQFERVPLTQLSIGLYARYPKSPNARNVVLLVPMMPSTLVLKNVFVAFPMIGSREEGSEILSDVEMVELINTTPAAPMRHDSFLGFIFLLSVQLKGWKSEPSQGTRSPVTLYVAPT